MAAAEGFDVSGESDAFGYAQTWKWSDEMAPLFRHADLVKKICDLRIDSDDAMELSHDGGGKAPGARSQTFNGLVLATEVQRTYFFGCG